MELALTALFWAGAIVLGVIALYVAAMIAIYAVVFCTVSSAFVIGLVAALRRQWKARRVAKSIRKGF